MPIARPVRLLALSLAALVTVGAAAQIPPTSPPDPNGLDVAVAGAPTPVRVGGADRLLYELHVTNLDAAPTTIERLEVVNPARSSATDAVLAAYDGPALAALLGRPGLGPAAQHDPTLNAGLRAVLYLELPVRGAAPPARLAHRLTFRRAGAVGVGGPPSGCPARFTVDVGPVRVDRATPPTFGPPLRGGPWAAVYDPGMDRGHRRVLYAIGGRARIPGRFAIDWFRVDDRGRTGAGTRAGADAAGTAPQAVASAPDRLGEFFGYGAEVLAVADGVVAAARDGVAETERASAVPRVPAAEAAGNYVALAVGGDRYAVYEHLRPGLRVRVGQRVRRGQVLGALGLTGQGSAPHLHFHVADAPAPLGGEGRPYRLAGYTVLGGYASIAALGRGEPWAPAPAGAREAASVPAPNAVITFERARTAGGPAAARH